VAYVVEKLAWKKRLILGGFDEKTGSILVVLWILAV
jgi:hypothetical protein